MKNYEFITSYDELVRVYTEWNKRLAESPSTFVSPERQMQECTEAPEETARVSAEYVIRLMQELREKAGER